MELRQLRYFVAVAKYLNFSKASRAVHVSQPTISHQIKHLEEELGFRLFDRSVHEVKLTPKGVAFLPHIMEVLQQLDEAVQATRIEPTPIKEQISIVTGVYTVSAGVLPTVLKRFNAQCSDAMVKVDQSYSNWVLDRFSQEHCDIAVGIETSSTSLSFRPLCEEELVLLVAPDHPLANRRRLRMFELHGQAIALMNRASPFRRRIDECFQRSGAVPRLVAEFDNTDSLVRAAGEQGIAVITPLTVPDWLKHIPLVRIHLDDPTPTRTLGIFSSPDKPLSKTAQLLADLVAEELVTTSRRQNDLGLRPHERSALSA